MPNRRNPRLEKVITPILFVLARVGFVGFYYPDAMIGKFVVRSRQIELRHMAGHAVGFGHWASLRARFWMSRFSRNRLSAGVAGQTFGVKIHWMRAEVVVWVVARQAADTCVVGVVAFAACQAIRLEADVGNTRVSLKSDFRPGAMTLTAEIRRLVRGEADQLVQVGRRRSVVITGHHRRQVRIDGLMAVPALNSRNQFVQGQLLSLNRISRVASKTTPFVIAAH